MLKTIIMRICNCLHVGVINSMNCVNNDINTVLLHIYFFQDKI